MRTRTLAQVLVAGMLLTLVGSGTNAQGAAQPGVVHFTAAGDFGSNAGTDTVLAGMKAANADLTLALGDLSYAAVGQEQLWCDRVTQQMGAGYPFELLAGNHESNGQNGNINDFSACLPNQLPGVVGTYGRQWYVDVPQVDPLVRFVMVSPAIPFPDGAWSYAAGSPRYNWTAAAIDSARSNGIPWVVVSAHKPCYSMGVYTCEIGADFTNMLISKRVDLVLSGHEHMYQRSHQLGIRSGCARVEPNAFNSACLADTDAAMNQGAGTVFATSGLGGQEQRTVNNADAEAGYFAAASGINQNPTNGFLDVTATADDLTARFVPVAGGTFSDAFVIRRGDPPPQNQPPVSDFISSTTGLTAAFDGAPSRDPDGTLTGYAWSFGDGASGQGGQAQHAYAAPGTYQVTLTVTDDRGATGSVTKPVTVTAPPPPSSTAFVVDSFDRSVTNGLGSADVGGVWTLSGSPSNFAVATGAAALTLRTPTTQLAAWLGSTTRTDTDLRATFAVDRVPTGNGVYLDVAGRRVGANNEYRARLLMRATGDIDAGLTALRGSSTATDIQSVRRLTGVTYGAGTQLAVRFQVTGTNPTTLRLKVWPAGSAEPAAWQLTATDGGASLQAAGAVGVTAYLSGGATNAPVVLRMSGLSARPTA
jgi:PKD repeat protein